MQSPASRNVPHVLTTLSLLFAASFLAPRGSALTCHGPLPAITYRYLYTSELTLNNDDVREPAGFAVEATFALTNIWQSSADYLAAIAIEGVRFKPRSTAGSGKFEAGPLVDGWPVVVAHVEGATGVVKALYAGKDTATHHSGHRLEPTQLNLVVGFLNALRSRFGKQLPPGTTQNGRTVSRVSDASLTTTTSSLLLPLITDHWSITASLISDHDIPELVTGWQNVTLESKIFPSAHSRLTTEFTIKLLDEKKGSVEPVVAEAVEEAVKKAGTVETTPLPVHFIAEKKPCAPHYCGSLEDFLVEYSTLLTEDQNLAKTSIGVAYLRLLDYLRINSGTLSRKDIGKQLKKYFKARHHDGNIFITLLDAIAGSRHGEAMLAAAQFLDLAQCSEASADVCERFLVAVGISAITTANMGNSYLAEHSLSPEQLVELFLPLSTSPSWADERVKHAYGLTMATLVHAYQVEVINEAKAALSRGIYADALIAPHSSPVYVDVTDEGDGSAGKKLHHDKLGGQVNHALRVATVSEKTVKYLIQQLDGCKETDCRVVYLHALGNARILSKFGVVNVLKKWALSSGKRESVAAMKALRDTMDYIASAPAEETAYSEKMKTRLRQLLLRVVYDATFETTSRLIAAELVAKYVDESGLIIGELVQHLDTFPPELATMIWKRAVGSRPTARDGDWQLQSKALSGSSASFKYVMGGTGHCNASYGVFLELLKGKLPKETNFNVEIGNGDLVQDVVNVGLFARGLQSFAGGDDTGDAAENEVETGGEEDSTLAGMSLQLLGNQLRPFLFFRSTSDLMSHMWAGTASEPTPVFRANLLLADYADIRPLINGFLVEQHLGGVLSLDLTGEVQVSLWNRNSHSNVATSAAVLFQGSQQIYTTDRMTSARKLFSIGGESRLNFITDFDFYNSPYRICIQITQPEFVFKHNTRKYEQVHSPSLHRRIHRRSYRIPAKSYILNRDNSEMCAIMNANGD